MNRFNGVSTKYINSYIKWFKWLYTFNSEKDTIKTKSFIVQSNIFYNYTTIKAFKTRQPIFI